MVTRPGFIVHARVAFVVLSLSVGAACSQPAPAPAPAPAATPANYFDNTGRADAWSGGARMIPIKTPKGEFRVWTKRVGNNPKVKLLLLHGGPAATHEYFEVMDSFLPGEGIEFYYYDQLGSFYSDQPDIDSLYELPRFVDEVEQVRVALGLDKDNFYLLGHSWGGILAMEYALAHQDHLKGLIISNMMASIPAYNEYAEKVLMPAMDQKVLADVKAIEAKKDFKNPRYMELLMPAHYEKHLLRRPAAEWPEPVQRAFAHLNEKIYVPMQGPSELGASGKLVKWDRTKDLKSIAVPTLVIGAEHDTMDPKHMEWMSKEIPGATYLYCPNGSHMAMYDDQATYMKGLIAFLKKMTGPGVDDVVRFIIEIDKLKGVTRKVKPLGLERYENPAEHTWQIALLAWSLAPFAASPVDINRVVKLLLVHDIGEIDTGDTMAFVVEGVAERKAAERAAVERIFGLLPAAQRDEMLSLWLEFDEERTAEARLAHAADRAMPVLLNLANNGQSWRENHITYERVVARVGPQIEAGCPALWRHLEQRLADARDAGWFGLSRV